MTYDFLQHYWCFIVSLLGALLVFLLFVQGANSCMRSLGQTEEGMRLVINSTGRKWEFTFTTLVTFGGAFFASFPLFYSTSFGGAYWLWMLILFTFVLQAVSYEFQNKIGRSTSGRFAWAKNFLGPRTFRFFLVLNGLLGPLLLGGAVATFFEGSNFIIDKSSLTSSLLAEGSGEAISHWANASHGLDALLNPWVLVFGLAVMFLARTLGILYVINNVNDDDIRQRAPQRLIGAAVPFVLLFVTYLIHLLLKDGYAYTDDGLIYIEHYKYLNNLIEMWPLALLLVVGVVLVLWGIIVEALRGSKLFTIHYSLFPASGSPASAPCSPCCPCCSSQHGTTRPTTPPRPTCSRRSRWPTAAPASSPSAPCSTSPSSCPSCSPISSIVGERSTQRSSTRKRFVPIMPIKPYPLSPIYA